MFTDPISLDDSSAASHSFTAVGFGPGTSTRVDGIRLPNKPLTMKISHQQSGASMRRSVRFDDVDVAVNGAEDVISAYIVIVHPRNIDPTARVLNLVSYLKDFLDATNVPKILDGEI